MDGEPSAKAATLFFTWHITCFFVQIKYTYCIVPVSSLLLDSEPKVLHAIDFQWSLTD